MLILFVLAGALLAAAAVLTARYRRTGRRERNADLVVFAAAAVSLGCTLAAMAVQLTARPDGEFGSVVTAGAVSGGVVTAVFGLWLNHRRYRIEELRHAIDADKNELEQRKLRLEQDKSALDERTAQRENAQAADAALGRAVELFGHAEARVRAGALYTLVTLAAHRPDRVQEAVDLVCLYLRDGACGEDPVRRDAQQVLLRIVRQANKHAVTELELDLAGAHLADFVLAHVTVRSLDLSGATLTGITSLHELRLAEGPFGVETAHRVSFDRATVTGEVWMYDTHLRRLSAEHATFEKGLSLRGAHVEKIMLSDSTMDGLVDFGDAAFGSLACNETRFTGRAIFRGVRIGVAATFVQSRFANADLGGVHWPVKINLDHAGFTKSLCLPPRAGLPQVSLRRVELGADVPAEDFPEGWAIRPAGRDGIRYLVAV